MSDRRAPLLDAVLYAAAAAFAGLVAALASIPIHREWGRLAAGPYTVGAVAAVVLTRSRRSRVWLAVLVLASTALLPLALESVWRSHGDPGLHAQSEAIVTEEAARVLLDGRDPYAATYLDGPLHARPLGTKTHFPYLPGMLVFGLPRAFDGRSAAADARVAFAAVALVAAWAALRRGPAPAERRLRALQVMAVLPTGALLMATGGDDLPVLGLMLLAVALATRHQVTGAGLAAGAAAALKLTAWPFLPFLALAVRDRDDRPASLRFLGWATAVALPPLVAFVAWGPRAFFEDVVKFPLGLGTQSTPAQGPTPGALLARAFPGTTWPLAVLTILAVVGLGAGWLRRRGPWSASLAAGRCGALLGVAIVLAPAGRTAYLVYPLNLLVWAWMVRSTPEGTGPADPLLASSDSGRPTRRTR